MVRLIAGLGGNTMSDEAHGVRLDAVEREVSTIRTEMGGIKDNVGRLTADVRGLGDILQRIEAGVAQAHQRFDSDKEASRLNPVALGSVLLTIISVLVGGAWLISGELARHDERSAYQQRLIDLIEARQWEHRGRIDSPLVVEPPREDKS